MRYKILLDLSAIKSGGGAQRARNFLDKMRKENIEAYEITVLKTKNYFSDLENENHIKTINNPKNFILRNIFEHLILRLILEKNKYDIILTFVGSGLPKTKIFSIVGVAYPIVCYDESVFWNYLSKKKKFFQRFKNHFRKKRIGKADMIFVQTSVMECRLKKMYPHKNLDFKIIPPAPSDYITPVERSVAPNYLLLSGNGQHKNLWRLYEIAQELVKLDFKAKFILSINKKEWLKSLNRKIKIDEKIVNDYFNFIGRVNSIEIQRVYNKSSFVLQLSDLESFSNNYMEAWKAGLPLIVSDRDFARSICQDSAIYVEPHNPKDVAKKIVYIYKDIRKQELMISKGRELLKALPSQEEYMKQMIELINYGYKKSN